MFFWSRFLNSNNLPWILASFVTLRIKEHWNKSKVDYSIRLWLSTASDSGPPHSFRASDSRFRRDLHRSVVKLKCFLNFRLSIHLCLWGRTTEFMAEFGLLCLIYFLDPCVCLQVPWFCFFTAEQYAVRNVCYWWCVIHIEMCLSDVSCIVIWNLGCGSSEIQSLTNPPGNSHESVLVLEVLGASQALEVLLTSWALYVSFTSCVLWVSFTSCVLLVSPLPRGRSA